MFFSCFVDIFAILHHTPTILKGLNKVSDLMSYEIV